MNTTQDTHSQARNVSSTKNEPFTTEELVSVSGLAKAFGSHRVLHDINLDAHRGEMVALLGANGCGKSTALCIVAGLETADQGEIAVPGFTGTAMIFQKIHLVPRRSALDNVCAGGLAHIPRWRSYTPLTFPKLLREEAMGCLRRVGLADRAHERCGSLSGGQQQRVAVARALCQQAQVILADEPTSALDPTAAHQVMELLRDICKTAGVACISVVHQPELALEYCDTIIGVRQGRIAFDRPAAQCTHELINTLYALD
ncbi:phosphonate ABC transporter ATP-binding protein [Corynebacterium falsenii]|uniref:phosphonate ABC transporter ATP-binding protein n=1 Tax=Corynebacterium falsenii TaxID=108486 RepID=UPI00046D5DAF